MNPEKPQFSPEDRAEPIKAETILRLVEIVYEQLAGNKKEVKEKRLTSPTGASINFVAIGPKTSVVSEGLETARVEIEIWPADKKDEIRYRIENGVLTKLHDSSKEEREIEKRRERGEITEVEALEKGDQVTTNNETIDELAKKAGTSLLSEAEGQRLIKLIGWITSEESGFTE